MPALANESVGSKLPIGFMRCGVHALLPTDPRHQLVDAILKSVARLVANCLANAGDIRVAMPDIAGAEFSHNFKPASPRQLFRQELGHIKNTYWVTSPDVEDLIIRGGIRHGQATRLDDVADVHEIALLLPILVDNWYLSGEHPT